MKYSLCFFLILLLSCSNKQKAVKVKGSDTEVNLAVVLAEHFYKLNRHYRLAISGGGSGLGIASLLNNEADMANSSRPLTAEEKALFEKRGIALKTVVFAEDATAFIVHKNFPVDSISVDALAALLSGKSKTWQQITGKPVPVNIYGRQSNSGTYSFVQKKLGIQFSTEAKEMNGNAQIMEGIKTDESGIGYVGAGYIMHDNGKQGVKVLRVIDSAGRQAISPLDAKAITEGRYFFQRPLYQFVRSSSWGKVVPFINFEKSPEGQQIIRNSGYYIID
ncbi:PstS family phosphate ABC transporter substrate-binding protein [Chitinophaga ginsengisoli]|uniref:Phosphate ABC transporter substrate-binding protein (PhoT family) n=1 Tax=Chitinophaga ginsengisoli TaxID=363837 RepID=A0A2P8G4S0_9BACT|nr:PstS family phosphate ABC transporter substrate-binding protein [Chitinophaga ginsengisoli]PSL28971.1 phosphate ABC transporter substrate-binding protein (PhoT family) [Chitinophaga ginsengisoli]